MGEDMKRVQTECKMYDFSEHQKPVMSHRQRESTYMFSNPIPASLDVTPPHAREGEREREIKDFLSTAGLFSSSSSEYKGLFYYTGRAGFQPIRPNQIYTYPPPAKPPLPGIIREGVWGLSGWSGLMAGGNTHLG